MQIAFQGVLIYWKSDGSLLTSEKLCMELRKNILYCTCSLIEGPIWTKVTIADNSKEVGVYDAMSSHT